MTKYQIAVPIIGYDFFAIEAETPEEAIKLVKEGQFDCTLQRIEQELEWNNDKPIIAYDMEDNFICDEVGNKKE